MQKIQAEKTALRRQLIVLVIMSVVVTAAFYGITLMQNPYKSSWKDTPLKWEITLTHDCCWLHSAYLLFAEIQSLRAFYFRTDAQPL